MKKYTCGKCKANYTDGDNLWSPGECPFCGWSPQKASRLARGKQQRAARVREQDRKARNRKIRAENMAHPYYGFVLRLTEYLARKYEGEVEFKGKPAYMSNIRGAQHQRQEDGSSVIRYGYHAVDWWFDEGFDEKKTYRWVWDYKMLKGYGALWQLVIHEFAHALQCNRNGRWRGGMHTQVWAEAVLELKEAVPLEMALAIAKKG